MGFGPRRAYGLLDQWGAGLAARMAGLLLAYAAFLVTGLPGMVGLIRMGQAQHDANLAELRRREISSDSPPSGQDGRRLVNRQAMR